MDFVLNPRVRIRRDGETLWVQAPSAELGLQTHEVSSQRDRALFDTILSILTDEQPSLELDDVTWQRMDELGLVIAADAAAPDLAFACELPRVAAPAPWARRAHPTLVVQRGPDVPDHVARLVGGAALPLAPRYPIAWVTDPVTGIPAPYVAGRHAAVLAGLRAGELAPDDLPDETRAELAAAELLVAEDFTARREAARAPELEAARRSFADRGWAVLRGLLLPALLPALRAYVRSYVAAGYARRGDLQVPLRWASHDQHLVTLIHHGLAGLVARVTGCATKASYSYFASYMPGAVLNRHRDRAQCKYSLSLQLDAEPSGGAPWPIHVEDLRGELGTALLEPGDALCYRGCDLVHWRDALSAGRTSTSAFLHYVDHDFVGSLV